MANDPSSSSILDLNDDVVDLVCQTLATVPAPPPHTRRWATQPWVHPLVVLSMTCKRLRHLAGRHIFHGVGIDLDAEQCSWNFIVETILVIRQGPMLKQSIRRLMLDRSFAWHQDHTMEQSFLIDFIDLLEDMPQLDTLQIYTPYDIMPYNGQEGLPDHEVMEYVLEGLKSNTRLPQIKNLSISSSMPWLVNKCPNLKRLQIEVHVTEQPPIAAMSLAVQLTHLRIKTDWSPRLLKDICYAVPNLVCLEMHTRHLETAIGTPIYEFIETLAGFRQMRRLILPKPHLLNVGLHPHSARQERQQANLGVAKAVFGTCIELRELWLGVIRKGTCTRTEDGIVEKISWTQEKAVDWTEDM